MTVLLVRSWWYHHPANEDPLDNEAVAQHYARDATDLLYEEVGLWELEDMLVPRLEQTQMSSPPTGLD